MTSGLIGAPQTSYYLVLNDQLGNRLRIVTDYASIDAARNVSALGSLVFTISATKYSADELPIDGIVELWRTPINGAPKLFLEALWFIREIYKDWRGSQRVWRVVCYDLLYLLGDPDNQRGRIIAYNVGNAFTDKLDEADNMCKAIVRENAGALATDTTRDLSAYLTVAADVSLAAIIRKDDLSRRVVLPVLQEIAQASAAAASPVYLAFDIVCTRPPSLTAGDEQFAIEFRTYTGQRGQDHRTGSANPVLIGPNFNNIDDAEYGVSHTAEANYIYARGQGVGSVAAVLPASDAARIGISPFNRREYLQDASDTADLTALQDEANAALRAGRPRQTMTGSIIDSDQARFDVDWTWGDYLPAQIDGFTFDCRVESIAVSVTETGERVTGRVRGDDVE